MLIKRLKLKNIRSYKEADIAFPEGIVLLSGDIGSGKSSILLSVEFALFGLLRGELAGSSLLRHGSQEGFVELTFNINNVDYTIRRTLKKNKKSIEQSAGYLLVNGVKKDASATELKSEVLNILGYPKELLTKSKSLIYRFTLYTPQEEMKRILFENEEDRLAILRKVFDIDKYERIKQNAANYNRGLKEKVRQFEGRIADKKEKQELKEQIVKDLDQTLEQIKSIQPNIELAKTELENIKKELEQVEKTKQKVDIITNEIKIFEIKVKSKEQSIKDKEEEFAVVKNKILLLKNELKEVKEDVKSKIVLVKDSISRKEKEISGLRSEIAALNAKKSHSNEVKVKINQLSVCPTCLQEVSANHKLKIVDAENLKISEFDKEISEKESKLKELEQGLLDSKNHLEKLLQADREIAVQKLKSKQLNELTEKEKEIEQFIEKAKIEIEKLALEVKNRKKELEPLLVISKTYEKIRTDFEKAVEKERNLAVEFASVNQKKSSLQNQLSVVEKELEKKAEIEKKLVKLKKIIHWIADYFVPLMDIIEEHVMNSIHFEFNSLFQDWFSMLIDDDLMSAKLNEKFTPIIEQNGYETSVNSLSGGEKTACALAYRLALNKTINKVMSSIKTKDLLILDEPTDGFSSEQLDKMRDVLEQLKLRQIILVSHEQKIEGFADSIIRVSKEEHSSRIL